MLEHCPFLVGLCCRELLHRWPPTWGYYYYYDYRWRCRWPIFHRRFQAFHRTGNCLIALGFANRVESSFQVLESGLGCKSYESSKWRCKGLRMWHVSCAGTSNSTDDFDRFDRIGSCLVRLAIVSHVDLLVRGLESELRCKCYESSKCRLLHPPQM